MSGRLFLIGTPIGNLEDITLRALDALRASDVVYCEDTRHTPILLNRHGIKKPLVSCRRENEKSRVAEILALLESGKTVALVSDAGMPCICDPGAEIARVARAAGHACATFPGPTAIATAACLFGWDSGFAFFGFLPEKQKARDMLVDSAKRLPIPFALYVAPHDLNAVLDYLHSRLGERRIRLARELTKAFEEVFDGSLSSTRIPSPRGEFVLGVEPASPDSFVPTDAEIRVLLEAKLRAGLTRKSAVEAVASERGLPKGRVYDLALKIKV